MSINELFLQESTFKTEEFNNNVVDGYKLMRWFYKIGYPIMTDKEYDNYHQEFLKHEVFNCITNNHYEDDDFPSQAFSIFRVPIKEYQIEENKYLLGQNTSRITRWESELKDEESKSIFPIETVSEAYKWFLATNGQKRIVSLKVDGINTKNLYTAKGLRAKHGITVTRSRKGSGIDVTDSMSRIVPQEVILDTSLDQTLFIRGEAYVPSKSLPYLREKYYKDYKIPRSTAMSVMRVRLKDEDMSHLKLLVFKTGLGHTVEEGYLTAKKLGFETPPYIKTDKKFFSQFEFETWIQEVMDDFYRKGLEADIPSDGLVAQVNDLKTQKDMGEFGNYNHGAIALKFNQWSSDVYHSVVKNILVIPNKEKFSYVAEIEPTTIKSGVQVSRVNIFNAEIMIRTGINVGKPITFEYKSESSVNLVY